MTNELYHHGILGQKWGVRRYQNPDGSLTPEGKKRYREDKQTLNDYRRMAIQSSYNSARTMRNIKKLNNKTKRRPLTEKEQQKLAVEMKLGKTFADQAAKDIAKYKKMKELFAEDYGDKRSKTKEKIVNVDGRELMTGTIVSVPEGMKIIAAQAFVRGIIGDPDSWGLTIGYKQAFDGAHKKYNYLSDRQRELDQMLRDKR